MGAMQPPAGNGWPVEIGPRQGHAWQAWQASDLNRNSATRRACPVPQTHPDHFVAYATGAPEVARTTREDATGAGGGIW